MHGTEQNYSLQLVTCFNAFCASMKKLFFYVLFVCHRLYISDIIIIIFFLCLLIINHMNGKQHISMMDYRCWLIPGKENAILSNSFKNAHFFLHAGGVDSLIHWFIYSSLWGVLCSLAINPAPYVCAL